MTPKEKAEELVNKFYSKVDDERIIVNKYWSSAKYCALIAVDEILDGFRKILPASRNYWEEVKQEIGKL